MTSAWPTALRTALHRGQLLVAEVAASTPNRRAWVAVYPRPAAEGPATFNLFHREFDRAYIDSDRCIGPGHGMVEIREARAVGEPQLTESLAAWKVEPKNLTHGPEAYRPGRLG